MRSRRVSALMLWGALALVAVFGASARSATVLDPPAIPPLDTRHVLAPPPRSEAPPSLSLDPDADVAHCVVCQLAARTQAALPSGRFRFEPVVLENGAVLRLVSSDAEVRDALWKATLARGELVATLRSGGDLHLCAACKTRRELLAKLDIAAVRIPEGVQLVYTSANSSVVNRIHTLIRTATTPTAQF